MTKNTNSELIVFDCESVESTFKSISNIYSVKPNDIENFLMSIDIDEYFQEHDPPYTPDKVITDLFEKEFNKTFRSLDYVFWFHLTRIFRDNDFSEGILPLNQALEEKIWPAFFKIFRGTKHLAQLKQMKQQGVDDHLYQMKTKYEYLGGPYAHLIYNKAFEGTEVKTGYSNSSADIIKDICNGYKNLYNESIHDVVWASSIPCMVKFKSREKLTRGYIRTRGYISVALYYLYNIRQNRDLSLDCNTSFDSKGKVVPAEDIEEVKYL